MPLPERRTLPLFEAAQLIADRCRASIEEVKHALDQAFREFALSLVDCCGRAIDDWQYTEIDWERGSITYRGPSVIHTIDGAYVFREHLDAWVASAASVTSEIGRHRRPRGPALETVTATPTASCSRNLNGSCATKKCLAPRRRQSSPERAR
jgi:hypothetical protein